MTFLQNKELKILKGTAVAIILLLTAAPFFCLFFGSVVSAIDGTMPSDSGISITLFFKSVVLQLNSSLLCVLLGFLSAIGIWVFFEKYAEKIAVFILLLVLIPPFVHVQSWINFIDRINDLIGTIIGFTPNFSGNFAVILTVAFSYMPLTTGLCLIALLSIPPELSDLCITDGGFKKSFTRIYLPFIYPSLILGGLLIFLLNINDYGIPSVFGVNVYALELFSRFSAGGTIYSIFIASFPLLFLSILIMILFSLYIKESDFSFGGLNGKNPFKKELFIKFPAVLGIIIILLFILVPLVNLIFEASSLGNVINVLAGTVSELNYSIFISIMAALFCLIPAMLFAFLFNRSKLKLLLLSLIALPFIIPGPIAGISLIQMWNTPFLSDIYMSPLMPSIGLVARFTFIETIILTVAISRLDSSLIDNMRLHYPGAIKFFTTTFSLIWKECVSAVLIVFALAMGEFGIILLITPPGYQTLTVKIYNYVHYGSSETVAAMCLFMLVVVLIVAFAVFILLKGRKNEK